MRKCRFTESQISAILKESEGGVKVADLSRQHGFSAQTIYNWRAKYGGLGRIADPCGWLTALDRGPSHRDGSKSQKRS